MQKLYVYVNKFKQNKHIHLIMIYILHPKSTFHSNPVKSFSDKFEEVFIVRFQKIRQPQLEFLADLFVLSPFAFPHALPVSSISVLHAVESFLAVKVNIFSRDRVRQTEKSLDSRDLGEGIGDQFVSINDQNLLELVHWHEHIITMKKYVNYKNGFKLCKVNNFTIKMKYK